jgi:hypothetical protein
MLGCGRSRHRALNVFHPYQSADAEPQWRIVSFRTLRSSR